MPTELPVDTGGTDYGKKLWEKHQSNEYTHVDNYKEAICINCFKILTDAEVKIHPPEGGFYLFPDFSNHLDFFKLKNINTSNQFCSQLLKDTGVALLPGEVFGRPKEEFTARLAYVNFDGTEAIRTSKKLMDNDQFNIEDLNHIITSLKSGIGSIVDWLKSN